jgi:NADH-quinone oxidoreductase subunit E
MSGFKVDHRQFAREGKVVQFSPEQLEKVEKLTGRYPAGRKKSALIPILHMAQEELGGYLSVDVMDYVAGLLGIEPVEVYEVATFYSQFYIEKRGRYMIEICHTGPCAICGGEKISDYISKKLAIKNGETTADGLFTLREVECLGACGYAPAMQINTEFYEHLTEEKVDQIIESLKTKSGNNNPKDQAWAERLF